MYGYPCISSVDEVHTLMLQKMVGAEETLTFKSKVELSHPPPCRDSLIPHVDRVNYRVGQWKHAHVPMYELPKPEDGHGWMKMDGFLEPVWSRGPILPPSLVDLLDTPEEEQEENEEEAGVHNYEELLDYLDDDD